MNAYYHWKRTRTVMTLVAVLLILGFFFFEQSISAQSPRSLLASRGNSGQSTSAPSPNSNCKQLFGTEVDLFNPVTNVSNGTITNGGFLNGTTLWTFPPGFGLTPDPNVVAFLADVTVITVGGQLKTHLLNTFNVVTGLAQAWGNIDPNTSTGRFAGATGVIFIDGYVPPPDFSVGPYTSSVAGQICFAE